VLVSEPDHGVATITLNRPAKRNALSMAVRDLVSGPLEALVGGGAARDLCTIAIAGAPRAALMSTKRKALARAGIDPASPTLDL
jgi:enoyl-CoA hydratase/carnithine racemase